MKRMGFTLAAGIAAAASLFAAQASATLPRPDPAPVARGVQAAAKVTFVAYSYVIPAVDKRTGKTIPHWWFRCRVPVRWHGRPNLAGHRVGCVLFHR